jgi:hypothetical protein
MNTYQKQKYIDQDFYLANALQRLRLHIAKEELAALVPTTPSPTAESYANALEFIDEHGADIQEDGKNPKRRAHLSVLAARTAAVTYATEKKRLANALNAVRQEIYEGGVSRHRAPPSGLE